MARAICPATRCRCLAKVYWKHLEPWWENLHAHARAAHLGVMMIFRRPNACHSVGDEPCAHVGVSDDVSTDVCSVLD